MNTEIYYFTGTGNSLVIARNISIMTNGKLLSISSFMNKDRISLNADVIGIVFPVYFLAFGGIPLIVERFIKKLDNLSGKYIFAICTFGVGRGKAIENLNKIIISCGGKLSAGFSIKMPYNYILPPSGTLSKLSKEKQQKMFDALKDKINEIYEIIKSKKEYDFEIRKKNKLYNLLIKKMNKIVKSYYSKKAGFITKTDLPFSEILPLMDKSFFSDGNCDGCGICKNICPVDNIEIIDNKPNWSHHCEQCFACLQWCPKKSIQFSGKTKDGERYHNPEVKLNDLIKKE